MKRKTYELIGYIVFAEDESPSNGLNEVIIYDNLESAVNAAKCFTEEFNISYYIYEVFIGNKKLKRVTQIIVVEDL